MFLQSNTISVKFTVLCSFVLGMIVFSASTLSDDKTLERLPQSEFDVRPPTSWVTGAIGEMRVSHAECRRFPKNQLRQRIVDIAKQEWAFFGYKEHQTQSAEEEALPRELRRARRPRLNLEESVRAASSIAGYWSVTSAGEWIIERQNQQWQDNGYDARWRDAWSSAFISWVMCEAGVGSAEEFRYAIAHFSYIDQAILARDGKAPNALYTAYDTGEAEIALGDLLCTGTRPRYENLDQRRAQLNEGVRSHCDIVVKVDNEKNTIDTIGGNVQSAVRLKRLWVTNGKVMSPVDRNGRPVFAHLKLRTS